MTGNILLRVAQVYLKGPTGIEKEIFALLDGAATVSMLDGSLAHQLGLKGQKAPVRIQWANNMTATDADSMFVAVSIRGFSCPVYYLFEDVRTTKELQLPVQNVNMS